MKSDFLTNYTGQTFLQEIKDNLRKCNKFFFSVSFIKKAGLVLLINDIRAALERGAEGRIITSTYQNFTDIASLRAFQSMMNRYPNSFECHLDYDSFLDDGYMVIGYHSKGYLFEFDDYCKVIVGSSNITRYALLSNIEWDISVNELLPSELYNKALAEFDNKWLGTEPLTTELINKYTNKLNFAIERWDMDYDLEHAPAQPNYMQKKALKELNRYRAMGTQKALVVAAAGSGKTYLAAFDAYNFNPNRLLYIVHEGSILEKSYETFQQIFGNEKTFGLFAGGSKEIDADFLFATNISMASNLELFSPDDFDYIVIDECHRAAADTYKRIMGYFKPEFILGLTATPERMDQQDVFELFDENVPYELRMRDALINDLIVPFHYYGIRDQLVDYGLDQKTERRMISQIATPEHCAFIHEQVEKYRQEIPGKLKALVFCRNIPHAQMMKEALSEYYNTAYLTGKNDTGSRIRAYNDLQSDTNPLEMLCTVDILNEGVDIPGINMVIFLRPTESQTIFIQQLGRGLRKFDNKPFVTVLDFVGNNYKRSIQIVLALGSLSRNFVMEKKLLAAMLRDDFKILGLEDYGVQINIDSLSKEEIQHFIDQENFNQIKYLKQDYKNFKGYVNAEDYPKHVDYLNNDCAPDLIKFMSIKGFKGKKNYSYYNFLRGIDEENIPIFSEEQVNFANYLSSMLPLARPYEYMIFDCIFKGISEKSLIQKELIERLKENFSGKSFVHAIEYMKKDGFTEEVNSKLIVNCSNNFQFNEYILDLILYGLTRFNIEYEGCTEKFKLYNNYRMDQVQRVRCIDPGYTAVGTYYDDELKEVYIFASIHKEASTLEHLNYNDKFIEPSLFQWESMANLPDNDEHRLRNSKCAYLFIRKKSAEYGITLPFTYVGKGVLTNPRVLPKEKRTMLFDIKMENELPEELQYDFMNFD